MMPLLIFLARDGFNFFCKKRRLVLTLRGRGNPRPYLRTKTPFHVV
nr:MAG TPA: hypothetical protein [Caudoviricetes sp.]